MSAAALSTDGLGKRYGSQWALRDCTLEIPAGSVTALVGPNGAGKTTLLQLAVGLSKPSAGEVRVLGLSPRRTQGSPPAPRLRRAGAPALQGIHDRRDAQARPQAQPELGRRVALDRIERLGLPLGQKVGKLSGGQQAQVALTLASPSGPSCCCSTSRSPRSTRSPAASSSSR